LDILKFDPKLRRGEDTDLLIQILSNRYLFDRLALVEEKGYVYRFYPSKDRLTIKPAIRFDGKKALVEKYTLEENTLGYNTIKTLQRYNNEWKFCILLKDYLSGGSLLKYIKDTFLNFKSKKDRIKSILTLIKTIFLHKFLIPVFGIDFKYLNIVFREKNRYEKAKIIFKNYLLREKDGDAQYYTRRIFKKVF